ncbi:MAG: CotH kinase family protein [bacterium]|nr:CotH kinase family protein [bacterium]
MRRLHVILGIIGVLIAIQAIGMLLMALLIYQATPNSTLAQRTFIGKIPGVLSSVRIIDRSLNMLYRGPKPIESLQSYSLRVDTEDLQNIEDALPTELPSPWYSNLFLTEDAKEWADAVFTADGVDYNVKIRVRGDIFNHWAYRKKSWRVRFDKDQLFNGMREMNLIIPDDRSWFAEPLNVYRMKNFDLLHPAMEFVTVSLNGSAPMLYTQAEHWTKEMFEKQGFTGDTNVYKTGGGVSHFQQWDPVFTEIGYWDKYLKNPNRDTYDEVEILMQLAEEGAHEDPDYLKKLKAVLDLDDMISWYAVSLLSGSRHVSDFNVRFYFNPSSGMMMPLPWDISLYAPRTLLTLPGNALLNEIFRIPKLKLAVHKILWEYVNDGEQVAADYAERDRLRASMERAAYRDPLKIQSNRQVKHQLDTLSWKVETNIEHIQDELKISEVLFTERIPSSDDSRDGIVRILDFSARGVAFASLSALALSEEFASLAVEEEIQLWRDDGDGVWTANDDRIALGLSEKLDKKGRTVVETLDEDLALLWSGDPITNEHGAVVTAPHTRHRFFVVVPSRAVDLDAFTMKVTVRNAVTGKKADVIGETLVDERTFERLDEAYMSRSDFLDKYPYFLANATDGVQLRGLHRISETVIVPSTVQLIIYPGTTLRMDPGVSILSYAPVTMIGYKERPIEIKATGSDPWGVFAVLNASEPSAVQWTSVSGGSDAYINGAFFSGMFAFHGSPVTIVDSVIADAHGDDGLNLKNIYVDINRVRFEANSADGLDIDFALAGVVENSLFIDNGNDGLDISGSPIIIRNIEVTNSGDKCVSVGEGSTPLIYDSVLKGCQIGIAVKDDSHAKIERVEFIDNDIAISAYVKKLFFGVPSVTVIDSTFIENGQKILALSGAVITLDSAE